MRIARARNYAPARRRNRAQLHGQCLDPAQAAARFSKPIDPFARGLRDGRIGCIDHAAVPASAVS